MDYAIERFTLCLSTTYGKQKAEELAKSILIKSAIPLKSKFSQEEALRICDTMIKDKDKFLNIMGNTLKIRIMMGK